MYVFNPGDEVFVPAFMWPNYPAQKSLSKSLEWAQIKLTKKTQKLQIETCNDTSGYVYGGKIMSNTISKY